MWSFLEPFEAIYNHLEPFPAIWSHSKPLGSIWSNLEPEILASEAPRLRLAASLARVSEFQNFRICQLDLLGTVDYVT